MSDVWRAGTFIPAKWFVPFGQVINTMDNLPGAFKYEDNYMITAHWGTGFPIGFINASTGLSYIHNHVNLEIYYSEIDIGENEHGYRITRFSVNPLSIEHEFGFMSFDDDNASPNDIFKINNPIPSCDESVEKSQRVHTNYNMVSDPQRKSHQLASGKVLFTYDVIWKHDPDLHWASRWDIYLDMDRAIPARIHWYSIMNSSVTLLLLAVFVVLVYVRNLRRQYNRVATEEATEEGKNKELMDVKRNERWKLVYADVFRPPSCSPLLLSVFCGTGAQIISTLLLTIGMACLGLLSPSRRGSFMMASVIFYVWSGLIGGFVATRLHKTFGGEKWHQACTLSVLGFPGLCFVLFLLFQVLALFEGSTYAMPLSHVLILLIMWLILLVPLTFAGGTMANSLSPIDFPINPSKDDVPRPIPDQPFRTNFVVQLVMGSFVTFAAVYVEYYYIMLSWWQGQFYYVFPFLFLVLCITIMTCGGMAILLCHFQLISEDHRWWWRAFCNGGSVGLAVLLHSSLLCGMFATSGGIVPMLFYFGFMSLVSLGLMMMGGFVGVWSSLWFNKRLYALIQLNEGSEEEKEIESDPL
eukprot:CAMPEP_0116867486 /NCGR_PEP_ID=MMETSP0418-20121206/26652_1 /TAXON_ID=1158023 /ORGANISM="Astrosyne radiata, Strain 13vi08-1A" /LENGTH=581 /DNA_ID=CAMNT_0004503319 /DNA_START=128 /DNA_END=1873 /DNA_ORIENTATION=-